MLTALPVTEELAAWVSECWFSSTLKPEVRLPPVDEENGELEKLTALASHTLPKWVEDLEWNFEQYRSQGTGFREIPNPDVVFEWAKQIDSTLNHSKIFISQQKTLPQFATAPAKIDGKYCVWPEDDDNLKRLDALIVNGLEMLPPSNRHTALDAYTIADYLDKNPIDQFPCKKLNHHLVGDSYETYDRRALKEGGRWDLSADTAEHYDYYRSVYNSDPQAQEMFAELRGLEQDFGAVYFELFNEFIHRSTGSLTVGILERSDDSTSGHGLGSFCVKTEAIVHTTQEWAPEPLTDVNLGEFRIYFPSYCTKGSTKLVERYDFVGAHPIRTDRALEQIRRLEIRNTDPLVRSPAVFALQPNPCQGASSTTHPNVSRNTICMGAGQVALNTSVLHHRFSDAALLINSVLRTEHSESPYRSINSWTSDEEIEEYNEYSDTCSNCGDRFDINNEGGIDNDSENPLCGECSAWCETCDGCHYSDNIHSYRTEGGHTAYCCSSCIERFEEEKKERQEEAAEELRQMEADAAALSDDVFGAPGLTENEREALTPAT